MDETKEQPRAAKREARVLSLAAMILLTGLWASPSLAHKTFLMPEKFIWENGQAVNVSLSSSLKYPELQFGAKRDRIAFSSAVVGNHVVGNFSFDEHDKYLKAGFRPDHKGYGVVAMSSKSRAGVIKPEDADGYFDEIGAGDEIKHAFADLPGEPPLHRSYSKHAKAFFCVETCFDGRDISYKPVGQPLEFVAVKDSNNRFLLLREGKKLAGQKVDIFAADKPDMVLTTDENGMVTVNTDSHGPVLLMSVWITLPAQADGVYHSDYATLTVDMNATE